MGWFVRTTQLGVHVVYGQQAENSCGIACVIMVNFKLKKWQLGAAAATEVIAGPALGIPAIRRALESTVKAEQEVYAAYSKVSGQSYDGSAYTYAPQIAGVLSDLGIGTWTWELVDNKLLANKVLSLVAGPGSAPVIALVRWRRGGGHFVVCDTVRRTGKESLADFCDPWDAAVRTVTLSPGKPVVYSGQPQTGGAFEFGQSRHSYNAPKTGDLKGCIIYRSGD